MGLLSVQGMSTKDEEAIVNVNMVVNSKRDAEGVIQKTVISPLE
jgi:hypothetical protein